MNSQENIKNQWTMYALAFFMFISLGRLHELFPQLLTLPIGKVAIALAVLSFIGVKKKYVIKADNNRIVFRLLIFIFLAYLSIVFSVWKSRSLEVLTGPILSTFILFFAVLRNSNNLPNIRFIFKVLTICAAVLAYATATLNAKGRLSVGETFDPNDLAMMLVTILPLVYVLLTTSAGKVKLMYGAVIGILLFSIILTVSRGGFLGLIIVGAYLFLAKHPTENGFIKNRFSFRKVLLIVIAMVTFIALSPESYWNRISTIFSPEQDYNLTSQRGRIAIWKEGISIMVKRPFGTGVGAFTAAQGTLAGGQYQTAHNSLVLVGVELGIVGLVVFLSLYKAAYRNLSEIVDPHDKKTCELNCYVLGVKAAILGFFVTSFFLSQAYAPIFYTLLALTHKLNAISHIMPPKQEQSEQDTDTDLVGFRNGSFQ